MALRSLQKHIVTELRVIDGDTLEGWLTLGYRCRLLTRLRLRDVEGGELGTFQGERAVVVLNKILYQRRDQAMSWIGGEKIHDRYGRNVGDIQFADGKLLTLLLLDTGAYTLRDRTGTIRDWVGKGTMTNP